MKAEELRIGNLFIEKYTNKTINVIELSKKGIVFSGHFKELWQAIPIPLTEEWLSKFGFKISGSEANFNYFVIENWHGEYFYTGGEGCKLSDEIKYVHQLQNLYFALTNEELKIK